MKYRVSHSTKFLYTDLVPLGHNEAHLTPRTFWRQECQLARLDINPSPVALHYWTDYFGNQVTYFTLAEAHRELSVTSVSQVEVFVPFMPEAPRTPAWETVRLALRKPHDEDTMAASQFVFDSPLARASHELGEYARKSFPTGRPLVEGLLDLTARIYTEFKYDPTATCIHTPTAEVFQKRRGVCQDFAHLQIACLRSLGLAARYVSGYLQTDPPPGQTRLVGADASHAWLSVFCPETGWLDFDPTNNQMPSLRHVTLAWGRDYGDVSPVRGVFLGGGSHTMRVAVDCLPLDEAEGQAGR